MNQCSGLHSNRLLSFSPARHPIIPRLFLKCNITIISTVYIKSVLLIFLFISFGKRKLFKRQFKKLVESTSLTKGKGDVYNLYVEVFP